ncbi:hypothetical protein DOTSEDRAFT_48636 [Dothistroma septosporum NZE10]|uniref:OPA3-like protein n=1 Tax=Dothistroma septosporum (strain NZE10 / CBS 128990) TaxID=675120 RepID=N1PD89_DOTSN|nr:hypothetical protein DOTSEDRAFT_48636 [Dothistroma septosporum NZE10]
MSLTFKLLSLAIRTAAKPIGNYIKRQAKEHDGFRKFAVNQAQRVHRIDMRMRLGILHDPEAQQRMHDREVKLAEEKKKKAETPTVRTADEQKKFEGQQAKEARGEKKEDVQKRPKIKPLSETRAIELGANFFSEAFIFGVAVGLLVWDSWRSRSKEKDRRDDVKERIEQLEAEVESLRNKIDPDLETLHDLSERIKEAKARRNSYSWYNPAGWVGGESHADQAIEGSKRGAGLRRDEHGHVTPSRRVNAIDAGKKVAADEVKPKADKEDAREQRGESIPKQAEEEAPDRVDSAIARTAKR